MPIKWAQTKEEQIQVAEWLAGCGPVTSAVVDAVVRQRITFGAALITRKFSDGYRRN